MTVSVDIRADVKRATRQLDRIQRQGIARATARALNKTGTTIRKEASQQIRGETRLPAAFIKRKLDFRRATRRYLVWSMKALRATTNIIEWVQPGKQKPGAFRKQAGVRSRAWGRSKIYKGTFIGRGKYSGKLLVYRRDRSKRAGVASIYGPNIRSVFARILNALGQRARQRFGVVMTQELRYEIERARRR